MLSRVVDASCGLVRTARDGTTRPESPAPPQCGSLQQVPGNEPMKPMASLQSPYGGASK